MYICALFWIGSGEGRDAAKRAYCVAFFWCIMLQGGSSLKRSALGRLKRDYNLRGSCGDFSALWPTAEVPSHDCAFMIQNHCNEYKQKPDSSKNFRNIYCANGMKTEVLSTKDCIALMTHIRELTTNRYFRFRYPSVATAIHVSRMGSDPDIRKARSPRQLTPASAEAVTTYQCRNQLWETWR